MSSFVHVSLLASPSGAPRRPADVIATVGDPANLVVAHLPSSGSGQASATAQAVGEAVALLLDSGALHAGIHAFWVQVIPPGPGGAGSVALHRMPLADLLHRPPHDGVVAIQVAAGGVLHAHLAGLVHQQGGEWGWMQRVGLHEVCVIPSASRRAASGVRAHLARTAMMAALGTVPDACCSFDAQDKRP